MQKNNIKIYGKFSEPLFALFCAYVAWGKELKYGKFNQKSKTYFSVKKFLKENKIKVNRNLIKLFKKGHPSFFVLRVVRYNENFSPIGLKHEFEKKDDWYKNFDILLKSFYFENNLKKVAIFCEPFYRKQINQIMPKVEKIIKRTNEMLKIHPFDLGLNELIIVPNQIDRTRNGYGFRIGSKAYIIFSRNSGEINKMGLFVHEYLHSIINPMFEKPNFRKITKESSLHFNEFLSSDARKYYPRWNYVLIEYVIRMMEGWLYSEAKKEKYLKTEEDKRGFIKIREFDKYYSLFRKNKKDTEEFVFMMLESIFIKNR